MAIIEQEHPFKAIRFKIPTVGRGYIVQTKQAWRGVRSAKLVLQKTGEAGAKPRTIAVAIIVPMKRANVQVEVEAVRQAALYRSVIQKRHLAENALQAIFEHEIAAFEND